MVECWFAVKGIDFADFSECDRAAIFQGYGRRQD